jgi:hypothetical protein
MKKKSIIAWLGVAAVAAGGVWIFMSGKQPAIAPVQALQQKKREVAIQYYQTLAKEYPDHEKAREAGEKAAALSAPAKK